MAMLRNVAVMSLALLLGACSSMMDDIGNSVQQKFQQMLADKFAERLQEGIDVVIAGLAKSGGYLDDPLVQILLPPPLGLIAGVASDLQKDPEATLLQSLMNQAAEHTIPVAGPLLKNIITNMDEPTLEGVFNAGNKGASQYLQQQGGAMIQAALLPAITQELNANGAVALYGKLLDAKNTADNAATSVSGVEQALAGGQSLADSSKNVAQDQLGQYVAEQAMGGLFRKMAKQELTIRQGLQQPLG